MSVIWKKVWRDLWHNKLRTALVVLSTAVGVFALGFVYGTSGVMRTRMTESHRAVRVSHLTFYTSQFDQSVVDAILDEPDVVDAEGEAVALIRWKLEGDDEWRDATVSARADYEAQHMNLLELLEGRWPSQVRGTKERTLAVERQSSRYFRIPVGTPILVEFGRQERRLTAVGIVRYAQVFPPQMGGNASFFATPETVAWLTGGEEGFNRLHVRLASFSEEGAKEAGDRLKDRLQGMGLGAGGYEITDPEVHWAQQTIDSLLQILKVLGALSLGLSGFLIVNMMNALVAQQLWQIGVMKVVGATTWRVMRTYLATALVYGLLSLPLAVLPGIVAAQLLANALLGLFNVPSGSFRAVPSAVILQLVVGLVVPLVAALIPVISGANITPHQAISSYGLGLGFGRSWFDRLMGNIRRLPRPLALGLRNAFRRKTRMALTMITLILGGMMFMVVISVSASMDKTLEVLLDDLQFQVLLVCKRGYREARLIEAAESVPAVTRAELWDQRGAQLLLGEGEERSVVLWAVPTDSEVFHPRIVEGRALLPEDGRAILLNSKIGADEGIQVGDKVELTISDRTSEWTVVGLILNVNNGQRDNFVSFDALAREMGNVNRGALVMIQSESEDATALETLMDDLRGAYEGRGLEVAVQQSVAQVRQANKAQFSIITYLMLAMSLLAAIVGCVGLMSTMSINVLERGREIGVMRAIGARSIAVMGLFVIEGMLVGALSWAVATPLSYPGGQAFNALVSNTLFQIPLDFDYSVSGVILWLVIVMVLSALASLWPALRATQISVRESLAYE